MEDAKKAQQPKKLSDLQDEIIVTLNKLVAAMEKNASLLQENLELKEKLFKIELEERSTIVIPAHNGSKVVEANI